MPVNPDFYGANYVFVAGRPVYEPDADEIARRAAECRETWTEAEYHERAGLPYGEPVEISPMHATITREERLCTHGEP